MTVDPVLSAALLGSQRFPKLPPPPLGEMESLWRAIPADDPSAALLHALALHRALHLAGGKTSEAAPASTPCPPETKETLPPATIVILHRLLRGETPEIMAEFVDLATCSGKIVPHRILPDFLFAASRNPILKVGAAMLAGERGQWLARRRAEFAWLFDCGVMDASIWETGTQAERLAWIRHLRTTDPGTAALAISTTWKSENATMREAILKSVASCPNACDEDWLEGHALKDRRHECRELAITALGLLDQSAFHGRAVERIRRFFRISTSPLRNTIAIEVPAVFDPSWTQDGIKEKPPQGTGEKAWWLRQIAAACPIDQWPEILGCRPESLFQMNLDSDWQEPLIAGWIDSALRWPERSMPFQLIGLFAKTHEASRKTPSLEAILSGLIVSLPLATAYELLDCAKPHLAPPTILELLSRLRRPPPHGIGMRSIELLHSSLSEHFARIDRPKARALAACVPAPEIRHFLEAISQISSLPSSVEEFAITLELRQSLITSFQTS